MSKSFRLIGAVFLGLIIILGSLKFFAVRTPVYKALQDKNAVEHFLSSYLKKPVKIGAIRASWVGLAPKIAIDNFSINDTDQKTLLQVQKLELGINLLASLIRGTVTPGYLHVEGTHILLRARPNGIIDINDVPALQAQLYSEDRRKLDYLIDCFLSSGEKDLKNVDITYYDQDGHKVAITHLSLFEQSHLFSRNFSASGKLFEKSDVTFDGNIYGSFISRKFLYFKTHLAINNVALQDSAMAPRLIQHLKLTQGVGSINANINATSSGFFAAKGALSAKNIVVADDNTGKIYPLSNFSTRFNFQKEKNTLSVSLSDLQMTAEKLLPIHAVTFSQTKDQKGLTQYVKLDKLPLQEVSQFFITNPSLSLTSSRDLIAGSRVEAGSRDQVAGRRRETESEKPSIRAEELLNALSHLKPTGSIENFVLQSTSQQQNDFSIKGKLNDVGFSAWRQFPSVHHLCGNFNITPNVGRLKLDTENSLLVYKPLFRYEMPIKKLQAQMNWWFDSEQNWQIKIKNVNLNLPEGHASGYMNILVPKNHNVRLQSNFNFVINNLKHASKYLPVTIMPKSVVEWLDQSIKGGVINKGTFQLTGLIKDFPFDTHKGKFLIEGELSKGILQYQQGWPVINDLQAKLRFNASSMEIMAHHASTLGAKIKYAHATIKDLSKSILHLEGLVSASRFQPIALAHDENPLLKILPLSVNSLGINGKWQLALNLLLPLDHDLSMKPQYRSILKADKLAIDVNGNHLLNHVKGEVALQEDAAQAKLLTGNLLNQPFNLSMSSQESNSVKTTTMNLASTISSSELTQLVDNKFLKYMNGSTHVNAKLYIAVPKNLNHATTVLTVDTNLQGLGLNLPEPLKKAKESNYPTHARLYFNGDQLDASFNYHGLLNGILNFRHNLGKFSLTQGSLHLDSERVKGDINIPQHFPNQPIMAAINTLNLTSTNNLKDDWVPSDIPPLDMTISDLTYKDKHIKNIDLKLRPSGHNLIIKEAAIKEDSITLNATGSWSLINGRHETRLNGKFDSTNLGTVLNKWQITDNVEKGLGNGTFNLIWPNSPFELQSKTMAGSVSLQFNKGRITKLSNKATIGMDMGRVLTLFSLQTLQRRLRLDFSDLTQPGFSFDEMKGLLQFKEGNIFTEDAAIDGPVAKVRINGRIGLAAKDYNLRLTINPYVTSSLPVVATITAGPIAGAATWLADKVFSRQVKQMTEIHYTVTGSWKNPDLRPLKNLSEKTE